MEQESKIGKILIFIILISLFGIILMLSILLFGLYGPGYDASSFIYGEF